MHRESLAAASVVITVPLEAREHGNNRCRRGARGGESFFASLQARSRGDRKPRELCPRPPRPRRLPTSTSSATYNDDIRQSGTEAQQNLNEWQRIESSVGDCPRDRGRLISSKCHY